MDASRHSRAWEDNGRTTHSSTSRNQTPNPAIFLPHDRTLPSLSSVFERNSIRSASNHHIQSHNSGKPYSAEIKTLAAPDHGLKRPRLSLDQGRKLEGGISGSSGLEIVTDEIGHNNYSAQASSQSTPEMGPKCSACARIWPLIQRVLSGLRDLETEIYRASNRFKANSSPQQENDKLLAANNPRKDDLESSLAWAAHVVELGRLILGELATAGALSSTGLISRAGLSQKNPDTASPDGKSGMNFSSGRGQSENSRGFFLSPTTRDPVHHPAGPLVIGHDRVGNSSHEQTNIISHSPRERLPSQETPSAHSQPPSTSQPDTFAQVSQKPHLTVDPAKTSSPGPPFSAHSAHVQDLQHQVSTKTLALQTLQREHDRVLAAFSRQQTSYSTLDKKTKIADIEIKELTEEKIGLQSQVDNLEAQVEELLKSKEDAHQQSVASGSQYMKIMAMSSRLQTQSATDQKKWKAEKQEWETEKEALLKRIQSLETGTDRSQDSDPLHFVSSNTRPPEMEPSAPTHTSHTSDDLTSMPPEELRSEVASLRQRCREMEATLKDLVDETQTLDGVIQQLTCVSRRIEQKVCPELLAQQTHEPSEQSEEQTTQAIQVEV